MSVLTDAARDTLLSLLKRVDEQEDGLADTIKAVSEVYSVSSYEDRDAIREERMARAEAEANCEHECVHHGDTEVNVKEETNE